MCNGLQSLPHTSVYSLHIMYTCTSYVYSFIHTRIRTSSAPNSVEKVTLDNIIIIIKFVVLDDHVLTSNKH